METIKYTVDNEPQSTTERILTPRKIMLQAGIDPASHYLVLLEGEHGEKKSFEGKPDEPIHMRPGMRFISNSSAPTPVS